jgi:hypothetical protein
MLAEAKGGTGKLGGLWRAAATGQPKFLTQMGSDGQWVRDVIRRMKKSPDVLDHKMAEALQEALKKGRARGLVVSTPIKNTIVQETKAVQVIFE